MKIMGLIEHIASIPLFQGLPRKQHEDLSMIVIDQVFKRGQMVFSEGDAGNGLYVLISGRVKIFKLSPEEKSRFSTSWRRGSRSGKPRSLPANDFPPTPKPSRKAGFSFSPGPPSSN